MKVKILRGFDKKKNASALFLHAPIFPLSPNINQ